ncbi:hypothetical protein EB118_11540 [bacterium]|nr:hypothetical protein [bacterium]
MEENSTEAIEESVPSEIQESGEVVQSTPEIPIREAKVEVGGQVMQINERQLKALWGLPENESITDKEFKTMVSSYKAQKTSDIATRNARHQEKLVKEIADLIQTNPWQLLEKAGYNPRQLAEEYLTQVIEEDMLPENERELRRVRSEKEELERQYKEELSRREQEQMQFAVQQAEQEITGQIIDALDSSSLPRSPEVVKRIANYMLIAEQKGIAINVKQIIPLVEEDFRNLNAQILKSLDPNKRINYIGEDLLKQIRQDDLARLKTNQSQPNQSQPKPKQNNNKKITKEEWRKELAERIRS